MANYLIKRFLLIIPTFIGITFIVFMITRLVPGGPLERMLAEAVMNQGPGKAAKNHSEASPLSEEQMEQLKVYYGLDKPIPIAYVLWLKKVVSFDLGESSRYQEPVWDMIKSKFPISIYFGLTTLILTYLLAIPLGIIKAVYHKGPIDLITSIFLFLGHAVPSYVVALGLLYFFSSYLELFPLGGFVSDEFSDLDWPNKIKDLFQHTFLPLCSYLFGSFAVMSFLMKNSLMDQLGADYMKTAISKGVSFPKSIYKHALRNAFIPIATTFGDSLSVLISGSFLVETIFNIVGIGLLGYESIVQRDYPVVMGILVISSLLFMIGNIVSDLCVAVVDPRIRFE